MILYNFFAENKINVCAIHKRDTFYCLIKENEGIYDCQTKNCVKAFKNHYLNTAVISHLENIRDYEPYENHNPFMIEVTENTLDIMGEVADLLG